MRSSGIAEQASMLATSFGPHIACEEWCAPASLAFYNGAFSFAHLPIDAMTHESRLQRSLRELIEQRRTAALAVSSVDGVGAPLISMVPFAWCAEFGCVVLHVSALAAHTQAMQQHPSIAMLFSAPEVEGEGVHALERVSLQGVASTPPKESVLCAGLRNAYLARFPEAEFMTELPDFRFVCITPESARHVAGFGSARDVSGNDVVAAMNFKPD